MDPPTNEVESPQNKWSGRPEIGISWPITGPPFCSVPNGCEHMVRLEFEGLALLSSDEESPVFAMERISGKLDGAI